MTNLLRVGTGPDGSVGCGRSKVHSGSSHPYRVVYTTATTDCRELRMHIESLPLS